MIRRIALLAVVVILLGGQVWAENVTVTWHPEFPPSERYRSGREGVALYFSAGFGAGDLVGHEGAELMSPIGMQFSLGVRAKRYELEFYVNGLIGDVVDQGILADAPYAGRPVDRLWAASYLGLRFGYRMSLHRDFTITPTVGIGWLNALTGTQYPPDSDEFSYCVVERYPFAPLVGARAEYNAPWVWGPLALVSKTFDGRVYLDVNASLEHHDRPPWGKGNGRLRIPRLSVGTGTEALILFLTTDCYYIGGRLNREDNPVPHVACNDISLYYEESGTGTPVLFLHGFSLDHRQWDAQRNFFSDIFRVIAPDARGHGQSEVTATGYSRANRVEDLLGFVDALGIKRFHLVGLSMGGSTGIGFALAHQERLLSLALVSTGAAGYSVSKKFDRLDQVGRSEGADAARQKWMDWSLAWYKGERAGIGEQMQEMMDGYSGAVWADPMRGKYPQEDDLSRVSQITAPVAIYAGELDKVFSRLAGLLHEQIPSSQLTIYPETGHMVNMEQPELFNQDLLLFLQSAV